MGNLPYSSLPAMWHPPERRWSGMNISSSRRGLLLGLALPVPSRPSANPPQSHGLLGDIWLPATCPFSRQCSSRIAGHHPANLPGAKGKWLYWRVSLTFLSVPWVHGLFSFCPAPSKTKERSQNQKPFPKVFPLFDRFIHRVIGTAFTRGWAELEPGEFFLWSFLPGPC